MPKMSKQKSKLNQHRMSKCATGIQGLDIITEGGLPKNRTTLVCGGPGTGKTVLGIDFLVKGATLFNEPGIFVSFEESQDELYQDVASLNLDLSGLVAQKKIVIDNILLEPKDIQQKDFNLEGIFIRLEQAIDAIGATRVVIDSIESLFSGITDVGIVRLEIKRLFRWLKGKKVTTVVTGEMEKSSYNRHGLQEYISDCVLLLDNRIKEQFSVRRLRIVKYRGSDHGTNEYPFTIDNTGVSLIPITSEALDRPGTSKRVSTGIPSLDKMFEGKGYTAGSAILVSGTAGTGKTSIATAFAVETCKQGKRCLMLSYEESPGQLIQNMSSIGYDLKFYIKKGLLKIVATRPCLYGLEKHLRELNKIIEEFKPKILLIDPLTSLLSQGTPIEIESMVTRMIDLLKSRSVTMFCTSLVSSTAENDTRGEIGVSSLIDTWIVVRGLEEDAGKNIRGLYIVKSRGMNHSSDVHKLVLSDQGIDLLPMDITAGMQKNKGLSAKQADWIKVKSSNGNLKVNG